MNKRRFIVPLKCGIPDGDALVTDWIDMSGGKWDLDAASKVTAERAYVTRDCAKAMGLALGDESGPVELRVKISVESEPFHHSFRYRFRLSPLKAHAALAGGIMGVVSRQGEGVCDEQMLRSATRGQ